MASPSTKYRLGQNAIARHGDAITLIDDHTVFCDGVVVERDAVAKEGTVGFLNSGGSIDEFTCTIVVIDSKSFHCSSFLRSRYGHGVLAFSVRSPAILGNTDAHRIFCDKSKK